MKKFKLLLVILWMIIIFCFSNQPADDSSNLSNSFINNTIIRVYEVFNKNVTDIEKEYILERYSMPIRKFAHFTIYFILGILLFIYLKDYNINRPFIYSLLICFIYAITDEIHQYFVIGRYCFFIDVLIDSIGSITGIMGINGISIFNTRIFQKLIKL